MTSNEAASSCRTFPKAYIRAVIIFPNRILLAI
jgi:hypothetical protein